MYPAFYIKTTQKELKKIFKSTGLLRDEEVMLPLIKELNFEKVTQLRINNWLKKRYENEARLRQQILNYIKKKPLIKPLRELDALIKLPVKPKKDIPAKEFALDCYNSLLNDFNSYIISLGENFNNQEYIHKMRICAKKLRYNTEFYQLLFDKEMKDKIALYKKIQTILGKIHDIDVVISKNDSETEMETALFNEIKKSLIKERILLINSFQKLLLDKLSKT